MPISFKINLRVKEALPNKTGLGKPNAGSGLFRGVLDASSVESDAILIKVVIEKLLRANVLNWDRVVEDDSRCNDLLATPKATVMGMVEERKMRRGKRRSRKLVRLERNSVEY